MRASMSVDQGFDALSQVRYEGSVRRKLVVAFSLRDRRTLWDFM